VDTAVAVVETHLRLNDYVRRHRKLLPHVQSKGPTLPLLILLERLGRGGAGG